MQVCPPKNPEMKGKDYPLQGSKDKQVWEVLVAHSDDTSLGDPGSTATWPIEDDRTKGS